MKNLIKKNISEQIVTIHKKKYLKRGHKKTGEFKWVRCDRKGNEIYSENSPELLRERSSPRFLQRKSTLDIDSKIFSYGTLGSLKEIGSSNQAVEILNSLHKTTVNEADRIHEHYMNMEFSTQNSMNLYKTLLILFDEIVAAREISRFLKAANVVFFLIFFLEAEYQE